MARQRIKKTKTVLPNGTVVERQKLVAAPELEWRLQAAAVRAAKSIDGYGEEWKAGVRFTLAGDMNAARRSRSQATKDKATGLMSGEEDLRIYLEGGKMCLVEFKAKDGRLSADQIKRHELHRQLGFDVRVIKISTEDGAVDAITILLRELLADEADTQARVAA